MEELATALNIPAGEVARTGVQQYLEIEQLRKHEFTRDVLIPAKELIETFRLLSSGHPYQASVARWRLARTAQQINGIMRCDLRLDALPAEVYLTRALGELHADLGAQDEFLVVTNLRFWEDFSGTFLEAEAGNYLQAQKSAIARGMRLLRVFLLSHQDASVQLKKLKAHFDFIGEVGQPGEVEVRFVQCGDHKELGDAIQHIGHFACIRRRSRRSPSLGSVEPDEGCLVVEPLYSVPGRVRELRLLFSKAPSHEDETVRPYVSRILQVANNARPLKEFGRSKA